MTETTTTGCTCPSDCNCRSEHRPNYCGCRQHTGTPASWAPLAAELAARQGWATVRTATSVLTGQVTAAGDLTLSIDNPAWAHAYAVAFSAVHNLVAIATPLGR